jgi:hypothetical protein
MCFLIFYERFAKLEKIFTAGSLVVRRVFSLCWDFRTGANLKEGTLKVKNVNTNQFGLLFTRAVDDQVYAQPLIAAKVRIPGKKGSHNLVIVATVNDSVYAFDADEAAVSAPYWQVSFLNANAVPVRNSDMTGACSGNYQDFSGNIGIASTPVIDPNEGVWQRVRPETPRVGSSHRRGKTEQPRDHRRHLSRQRRRQRERHPHV